MIDAVVVAYNSRETLRACVEPLAALPWVSVTVVDNACPDDSTAVVADLPVRIIKAPRNGGFAFGCNIGIAAGASEHVLLINPDARLDAASLTTMAGALRSGPELGGVGPRTIDEAGQLDWTQRRFPRLRSSFAQALFLHRLAPRASWTDEVIRDPEAYARPTVADWLSGCCLLLRRDALAQVDGLDEGFFLYSEETDLFLRLRQAGWTARYVPAATVTHVGGVSAAPDTMKGTWARSRIRYARKHHGHAVAMLEAVALAIGALTRAAGSIHRPGRASAHVDAARGALGAIRPSRATR